MKFYKMIALVALVALTGVGAASCTVAPDAGQEAVLIKKPLIFGHGGVDPDPVKAGRAFVAPTTQVVYVDMKPVQYEVKFDDLMSSDGIPLGFDSVIRLQVTDSVLLISKFGEQWYENNVKNEFMNRVRQAVRKHGMNETAISTTAIDDIDLEVTKAMESYLLSAGMPVRLVKVTIGKANPPDSIKDQRIKTATEQQRQITEYQTQLAEDKRKGAEEARAAADNAYREALGLSPEQFIQLQQIDMQRDACSKNHCTFIAGASANPILGVH